jgi:MSHA biogenesis protein MshQ
LAYDPAVRLVLFPLLVACSFPHGSAVGPDDGGVDAPDGMGSGSNNDAGDGGGSNNDDAPPVSTLREKTITITGAVTGTLTDFPLWVSLTDADLSARARPDGSDIHFVAGTMQLDYEIQRWAKNDGELEAWVRVPTLETGTQIAIRYGDVDVSHAPDAPGTFTGYSAVWHMDDTITNTTIADARGQRNGTAAMLGPSDSVTAQLGKGINFSGANGEHITFTNPLSGNSQHTISLWVNQRATNDNDAMIVLGDGMPNRARWFHSRFNSATIALGFYSNDYTTVNEDIIMDGWVLLHWVYEGQNRMTRIYRNGTQVGTFMHGMGTPDTDGNSGYIGNAPPAFGMNMGLHAAVDEVRIINVAKSAAWVAAEAANQANPSMFYSVSAEQMP